MNINKEVLIGLGFKEIKVNDFDMFAYSYNGIDSLCLEKTHTEKEFYTIYRKDNNDNLIETCGHCEDLAGLFEMMMKINHMYSIKLGKDMKQRDIRNVLGLK